MGVQLMIYIIPSPPRPHPAPAPAHIEWLPSKFVLKEKVGKLKINKYDRTQTNIVYARVILHPCLALHAFASEKPWTQRSMLLNLTFISAAPPSPSACPSHATLELTRGHRKSQFYESTGELTSKVNSHFLSRSQWLQLPNPTSRRRI